MQRTQNESKIQIENKQKKLEEQEKGTKNPNRKYN